MGAALERLNLNEREYIARSILAGCDERKETKIGANCPWHEESTPGGAFYYDAEKDRGYCYSCQGHGDLIDIYAAVNGYAVDDPDAFRAFWAVFGPDKLRKGGKKAKAQTSVDAEEVTRGPWESADAGAAADLWREHAEKFVTECAEALQEDETALSTLSGMWGITAETARVCRMGYNAREQFRPQKAWGLPDELNQNGRPRCIHLPQGFVFPVLDASGCVLRVKIRMDNPKEGEARYKAVKGGVPTCYGIWGKRDLPLWVVVETERDACMLWQELHPYGIGAMGIGTARLAPDTEAHAVLSGADLIIVALDNDATGSGASWRLTDRDELFGWNRTYAHSLRWPMPDYAGKDPGDLCGSGMTAWEWISAALPYSLARRCERRAAAFAGEDETL